ncbi:hypothetical protein MNBD_GAMMA01-47 [hydrothermal vent metagenome]|uniref:Phosphohistidine phosphatase SixA n=1 Tax=hydrothermal vent metagenome TaxID=652676 RepID=A0A3B0VG18_9ZZZZ
MNQLKNIFISRHGHAEFDAGLDFDRQLTSKGVKAVEKTAVFIKNKCKELAITPELCISSAAMRTRQTAEIICTVNAVTQCKFYPELYSTMVSEWLKKIALVNSKNIILVGHNPTFSQMVNNLCGYEIYMKPANCAVITLEIKADGIIYPATLNDFYKNE